MAFSNGATGGGMMHRSITVVDTVSVCVAIVDHLLKCRTLGLDAEGVAPRSSGEISLVTLSTTGRHVYIFDVQDDTENLFEQGNLKLLLESSTTLKVVHDFRNIAQTLCNTFGVKVRRILDTHAAYQTIALQRGLIAEKPVGLDDLFELYGAPNNPMSLYIGQWRNSNPRGFTARPVTKCMAHYLAFNACCLLTYVYQEQIKRIRLKYWPLLAALSDDQLGNRTNSEDLVQEALRQAAKDQESENKGRFDAAFPEHRHFG